jgi:hypothetical protein
VYQIENSGQVLKARTKAGPSRWSWPRVSRTVLFLGLTSLFTDISSEMVSTILPLYLVFNLQLTPLAFGVIDGLYLGPPPSFASSPAYGLTARAASKRSRSPATPCPPSPGWGS